MNSNYELFAIGAAVIGVISLILCVHLWRTSHLVFGTLCLLLTWFMWFIAFPNLYALVGYVDPISQLVAKLAGWAGVVSPFVGMGIAILFCIKGMNAFGTTRNVLGPTNAAHPAHAEKPLGWTLVILAIGLLLTSCWMAYGWWKTHPDPLLAKLATTAMEHDAKSSQEQKFNPSLDPFQFRISANRLTEDALEKWKEKAQEANDKMRGPDTLVVGEVLAITMIAENYRTIDTAFVEFRGTLDGEPLTKGIPLSYALNDQNDWARQWNQRLRIELQHMRTIGADAIRLRGAGRGPRVFFHGDDPYPGPLTDIEDTEEAAEAAKDAAADEGDAAAEGAEGAPAEAGDAGDDGAAGEADPPAEGGDAEAAAGDDIV